MQTTIAPTTRTGSLTQQSQRSYVRSVLIILLLATFLNGLDSSEFTGASAVIARELHLSLADVGALASAFTIFLTVSIIPLGIWADRARRSRLIAACLVTWSLATALTGLVGNFFGLFITRSVTGIGEAGYQPAGLSLIGDTFKEDQRGKVISWVTLTGVVGPLVGMVLGGVIAGLAFGSWRLLFLITGIPGIMLAFFTWRLREPTRRLPPPAAQDALQVRSIMAQLRRIMRIKSFVCLAIIGVLTTFTSTALQTFFPILLVQRDTFALTPAQAGSYAGLVLGPTAIASVLLGGYLSDRLTQRFAGGRLLIIVSSIILVIPLNVATMLSTGTHNLTLFTIILVPTFFINMLHLAPLGAAFLDIVPAESRASANAIATFIQRILGSASAPLAIGLLSGVLDPGGQHFLHSMAGHDLAMVLVYTCPLAFVIAGLVGLASLRWIRSDLAAANDPVTVA